MSTNSRLPLLLSQLLSSKQADIERAIHAIRRSKQRYHSDLLDFLKTSEPDSRKKTIIEILMTRPTPKRLKQMSFLVDHPDTEVRQEFAFQLRNSKSLVALNLIARALQDTESWVRDYALIAIRDRSDRQFSRNYARSATPLILAFIKKYPRGGNRVVYWDALKKFAPRLYAKLQDDLDKGDPMRSLLRKVFDNKQSPFRSHKGIPKERVSSPIGRRYIYSFHYVDAEIRNGGIDQLHVNNTWFLLPTAIEGLISFGCPKLAGTLKRIILYYHRRRRARFALPTTQKLLNEVKLSRRASIDRLENEYYENYESEGKGNISSVWKQMLKRHPTWF